MGILISCIFLGDAFRRLRQVKANDQVISKKPVILLFISFGSYGIISLLFFPAYILRQSNPVFFQTVIVLDQLTFILSSLMLAIILFELLVIHARQ
jgi:hypothetical protein